MTRTQRDPASRNFVGFVCYFVLLRVGWVFKTESVLMPAVLTALGAGPTVRGLLPVLARLGNSIPQVLLAQRMQTVRRIRPLLAVTSGLRALPWAVLATVLLLDLPVPAAGRIVLFLTCYGLFWITNGMGMLCLNALQGKLVAPDWRGRLLAVANPTSTVFSVVALLVVLRPTLSTETGGGGFGVAFAVTVVLFLTTAVACLSFREEPAPAPAAGRPLHGYLLDVARLLATPGPYRRLVVFATFYYPILMMFPHFVALGRSRLADGSDLGGSLVTWVIVQNLGVGAFSMLVGPLADRFGNRFALGLLTGLLGLVPLVALALTHPAVNATMGPYLAVFALLGLTPVSQRIIANYILELAPDKVSQPQYLAALNLWQVVPLSLSPLFGWLIARAGFEAMFLLGSASLLTASAASRWLDEPRGTR